jgi:molybdate/tungstate transport system permease protein
LGKGLVESLVDIPLVLPHTVAGLMVYLLFMARGPIGGPLAAAGIFFEDAFPGIVAAMVFVSAPYYIDAVREGFARVPVQLEHVARTLGATRFRAFVAVALPLCRGHLVSGALLAWGRAVGEFAAVVMIAYFPLVVSTLIYQRFSTGGLAESRSVAFLMVVVAFLLFLLVRWAAGSRGRRHDHP